jgi:hypothetical protein
MIQALSFLHLGLFSVWFRRGTNWIEIGLIFLVLFWAVVLNQGVMPLDTFRTTASMTVFFFWLTFLNFLRGLLIEFAVFVSGVLHVVQRLGPFLLAMLIILIAFMVRHKNVPLKIHMIDLHINTAILSHISKCSIRFSWKLDIAMDMMRTKHSLKRAIPKAPKLIDSVRTGGHFLASIRC